MNDTDIRERLTLFKKKLWPSHMLKEWYGFTEPNKNRWLIRARLFAGTEDAPSIAKDGEYWNRFHIETCLQRYNFVPDHQAAASLALSPEDFSKAMDAVENLRNLAPEESDYNILMLPSPQYRDSGVIEKAYLDSLHKIFPSLIRRTFSSVPSYIEKLHEQLRSISDLQDITTLTDPGNDEIAHYTDALTKEPLSMSNSVFLKIGKPINLGSERCSFNLVLENVEWMKDEVEGLRNDHIILIQNELGL